jgi:hypothetical protein
VALIMAGGTLVKEKPQPRPLPPPRAEPKKREEKKNILEALEGLGKPPEPSKA